MIIRLQIKSTYNSYLQKKIRFMSSLENIPLWWPENSYKTLIHPQSAMLQSIIYYYYYLFIIYLFYITEPAVILILQPVMTKQGQSITRCP